MSADLPTGRVLVGDCRAVLRTLPDACVQTCITSPPYWGLRDYGTAAWEGGDPECEHDRGGRRQVAQTKHPAAGEVLVSAGANRGAGPGCVKCGALRVDPQIGLEASPDAYVAALVAVFREVRRVLRPDGTLWLNLGDTYCSDGGAGGTMSSSLSGVGGRKRYEGPGPEAADPETFARWRKAWGALKPKDLCGIPWRVALALQGDGWWLRSDIVWAKPNPMPESVEDRPTRSHEYVFLLTASERYFYDFMAVREKDAGRPSGNVKRKIADGESASRLNTPMGSSIPWEPGAGRNLRDVWNIGTIPFPEAHFAVFPPDLVKPCILAGTSEAGACGACGAPRARIVDRPTLSRTAPLRPNGRDGGITPEHGMNRIPMSHRAITEWRGKNPATTAGFRATCDCDAPSVPCVVLDPFLGSGTTAIVAQDAGRDWIGIDLNPSYGDMATRRTAQAVMPFPLPELAP